VVSTTFDFQRTGADILQLSDNHQPNFALYELLTAENGLAECMDEKEEGEARVTGG
jgi:hypothetical protein